MSDADYQRLSRAMLDHIEATLDAWLDQDLVDIDSHRTGGLLELSLPDRSKIVLNTQPPLQELWLAAKAGGYHFRYVDGLWRDTKTGVEFLTELSAQLTAQARQNLQLPPLALAAS
ncbi:iron donor protein CyaY [Paucibacter sp. APW11]|uniref:Iron-sulfur cluster assembly protein CyaY n=1 Tax=Roseateles aquae TaxID=3077235 RepID=A0ABU3PHV6_9BURK|nr:iron donor protein CyaY [Paucibacter sp. APW11]MDT9002154.1 iron donor protein CyaY [Paucibacter sp. APW11]